MFCAKRVRSAVEFDDIVQQHVVPYISCKSYLRDLNHALHWVKYRDTIIQLMCNRSPEWVFNRDPDDDPIIYWRPFDWADFTVEEINDSDAEGINLSTLRTGFDFAFRFGVQCTWFSGEPFTRE